MVSKMINQPKMHLVLNNFEYIEHALPTLHTVMLT